jgi:hypothetical protein
MARFEQHTGGPFLLRNHAGRRLDGALSAQAVGPIEFLCARFPVTRRLVGNSSFRAMARQYIASQPSSSLSPLHYGETLPGFLRSQGDSGSMEYVADIAELEMLRGKSSCAPQAQPIDAQVFPSPSAQELEKLRLMFHPSVFLVTSRFPVVTIWENNRCRHWNDVIRRWSAESALVARPYFTVDVWRLPLGGHAFISALLGGRTIAAAAEAAITSAPNFEIVSNLKLLAEANVVIGYLGRHAPNSSMPQSTDQSTKEDGHAARKANTRQGFSYANDPARDNRREICL